MSAAGIVCVSIGVLLILLAVSVWRMNRRNRKRNPYLKDKD